MNKAVFLDRDGTINVEKNYVHKVSDFVFIKGAFEALGSIRAKGYLIVIITNQAGIARGYYSEDDYYLLNLWMLDQLKNEGIDVAGTYFCPHHPEHGIGKYRAACDCRKPSPGMVFRARDELDIDLAGSVIIGDKESDIETGINAGIGASILVRSGHPADEKNTKADFIADDLLDALRYIP